MLLADCVIKQQFNKEITYIGKDHFFVLPDLGGF